MDNERLARTLARVTLQSGKSPADIEVVAIAFVSMRSKVQMSEVAAMIDFLPRHGSDHSGPQREAPRCRQLPAVIGGDVSAVVYLDRHLLVKR
jgi:hypothetical protein